MQEQPIGGFGAEQPTDEAPTTDPQAVAIATLASARHRLPFVGKTRAGYTTNKGRGAPKTKRKMALASRRRNRGK